MATVDSQTTDEYNCIQCNKKYKDITGIWKHNDKYHNNITTILPQFYHKIQ